MRDSVFVFKNMPVRRAVISLAVPTVISQIITVIYNMADTFFIGQLNDPGQVAATTVSMPLFIILTALANLFGIGGASKISYCLGQGKIETAKKCASFCFLDICRRIFCLRHRGLFSLSVSSAFTGSG